ncbi:MAG: hypothetical protein WBP72_06335, partial [Rhodocyclaceae bacterium]
MKCWLILPTLCKTLTIELYRLQTVEGSFRRDRPRNPFDRGAQIRRSLIFIAVATFVAGAWAAGQGATRVMIPGARIEPDSTLVLTRDAVLRLPGTSKVRAELPAGT